MDRDIATANTAPTRPSSWIRAHRKLAATAPSAFTDVEGRVRFPIEVSSDDSFVHYDLGDAGTFDGGYTWCAKQGPGFPRTRTVSGVLGLVASGQASTGRHGVDKSAILCARP